MGHGPDAVRMGREADGAASAAARAMPPPRWLGGEHAEANPATAKEVDAILARAMAPDLSIRQQSAAALAAELRSAAAVLDVRAGDAAAPSALLAIDDTADRNATGLLVGSLVVAAAAFGAIWWWLTR